MNKLIITAFILSISSAAYAENNDLSDYMNFGGQQNVSEPELSSQPPMVGDSRNSAFSQSFDEDKALDLLYEVYIEGNS